MFVSFFPKPSLFFPLVLLWGIAMVLLWYFGGAEFGRHFGMPPAEADAEPIIGVKVFISPPFLWFYLYFTITSAIFGGFWYIFSPHPWQHWSVFGSALILFVTYFDVQVSVAINAWYHPFWNLIQQGLSESGSVQAQDYYWALVDFAGIAFLAITVGTLSIFFVNHYVFRWRTAMNNYYMTNWSRLRRVEGAAQRVQEDTMRFAKTLEGLGVSLVGSIMTLIAFLPILFKFSETVNDMPIIGTVPHALFWAALLWAILGTGFLLLVGIKLPGLEFNNQRVEAAYRKELVYGEDEPDRAAPLTVTELFHAVRRNYFRLYFHYVYFNLARIFYFQADVIFPILILIPSIIAGKLTLGLFQQILNAFNKIRSSFQYLVNSWPTIIELLSVYKRLRAFEKILNEDKVDMFK